MYRGDIRLGDTIDFKFTTRRFTTGAPFTLAGSPAVVAYVGNGTTEITAGITLSVDFDGVTGLNNVRVVATSGNGFATATNVQLVISAGTVDSVSVIGEVVAEFSIENRSALMPTVAARTLDVTATGAAGIDWNNIENPTTAQNLSGTNIDTDQVVASVSGAVGSVTGAVGSVTGNVGGNVVGSVASVTGNVGGNLVGNVNGNVVGSVGSVVGAVGSVTGAVGSVTGNVGGNVAGSVGSVVGNVGGNVNGNVVGSVDSVTDPVTVGTNNDKTGYSLSAAAIQAIWDALTAALTTAGSIGKLLVDNINATISSRLASAAITLTGGKVTVGTNDDKTGYSIGVGGIDATSFAAGAIDAAALDPSAGQEIADEILDRDLQGGSSATDRNVKNALRPTRNKTVIAVGGAVTVYEEDDTTVAWTGTAIRNAAASPITEIDPA